MKTEKLPYAVTAFLMLFFNMISHCQDILIKTNGEQLQVKVIEVTPDMVKYHKHGFTDGPVYSEYKTAIHKITYENGSEDIFNELFKEQFPKHDVTKYKTFMDSRDSNEYKMIMIGNRWWMAENLKFKSPESVCNNVDMKNCEHCGYQYNFIEAGIVCPYGWHLPSDEEWMELENAVGMSYGEVRKMGWRGTGDGQAFDLLSEGSTGFEVLFCGRSNDKGSAKSPDEAFFWTSSVQLYSTNPFAYAWIRHFKLRASIDRDAFIASEKLNIRCIKD